MPKKLKKAKKTIKYHQRIEIPHYQIGSIFIDKETLPAHKRKERERAERSKERQGQIKKRYVLSDKKAASIVKKVLTPNKVKEITERIKKNNGTIEVQIVNPNKSKQIRKQREDSTKFGYIYGVPARNISYYTERIEELQEETILGHILRGSNPKIVKESIKLFEYWKKIALESEVIHHNNIALELAYKKGKVKDKKALEDLRYSIEVNNKLLDDAFEKITEIGKNLKELGFANREFIDTHSALVKMEVGNLPEGDFKYMLDLADKYYGKKENPFITTQKEDELFTSQLDEFLAGYQQAFERAGGFAKIMDSNPEGANEILKRLGTTEENLKKFEASGNIADLNTHWTNTELITSKLTNLKRKIK